MARKALRKPAAPDIMVLTAAMLWGPLTVRDNGMFYRKGKSDEPVCDLAMMARLVEQGLMKVVSKKTVEITAAGRTVEREAYGDAGKIVRKRR